MHRFSFPSKGLALGAILFAVLLPAAQPSEARTGNLGSVAAERQRLQEVLDAALLEIENNQAARACELRSEALGIVNDNFDRFEAAYPKSNWRSLQSSLEGSVKKCEARGNRR